MNHDFSAGRVLPPPREGRYTNGDMLPRLKRGLILIARYVAAGLTAAVGAVITTILSGVDENYVPLNFVATLGFVAVASGAFWFPVRTRCFRAVVLLCVELLLYCLPPPDANDYYRMLNPYPCLSPLVGGGLCAIGFHLVLYLLHLAGRPSVGTKRVSRHG